MARNLLQETAGVRGVKGSHRRVRLWGGPRGWDSGPRGVAETAEADSERAGRWRRLLARPCGDRVLRVCALRARTDVLPRGAQRWVVV